MKVQKSVSIALLATLTLASVSAFQPRPAHALVGAAFLSSPTVVTGASIAGLGLVAIGTGAVMGRGCNQWGCLAPGLIIIGGAGALVLGVLILDDNSAEFGPLSAAQARAFGLTRAETLAYEEELPEINAIFQNNLVERNREIESLGKPDLEQAKLEWQVAGQELSPEAFSAIKKIGARYVKAVTARSGQK